jgi:hypothetical protein
MIAKLPVQPKSGDREPVMDALYEMVDAAGGLEYSREALYRVIVIAQEEFKKVCNPPYPPKWSDANTPAVYYEFCNVVAWTRTVDDRLKDQLQPALQNDLNLWRNVARIRTETAALQFEDARLLAKCSLHKFTPPYANAGATVEDSKLIYLVPDKIINSEDFRANLRFNSGRHAAALVDEYWNAVAGFIDRLLNIFYSKSDE